MAKDVYYFSHDTNARNDVKILKLRSGRNGAAKYGIYWMILELMRESSDISLPKDYKSLAWNLRCPVKLVQSVVEDYNLFTFSDTNLHFFSKRLQTSAILFQTKSQKAKDSANSRWQKHSNSKNSASERNANAMQSQSVGNAIKEIKKINKESKVNSVTLNLFNLFRINEDNINDSILSRAEALISVFSLEKVKSVFAKVSLLPDEKRNIAYIEYILNNPEQKTAVSSNSKENPTQYRNLTPTFEDFHK